MDINEITPEQARRLTQLVLAAILAVFATYNAGYFVGGLITAPSSIFDGLFELSLAMILGVVAQHLFLAGMRRDQ